MTTPRIVRFGIGSRVYTFPGHEQKLSTNFAEIVPSVKRLPGMDGGYDAYGLSRAPAAVGKVQLSFTLVSATRTGMDTLRDALKIMRGWGVLPLYLQPTNPASAERWCWARVIDISMPEDRGRHSDLWQKVQITWQVSDPAWLTAGNSNALWGDFNWGSGTWGGGSGTTITGSGTITLTNNGNLPTPVDIAIRPTSGNVATDPIIRRIVGGAAVDQLSWTGTLTAADTLNIRASSQSVYLNAVDAYDSRFSALTTDWLLAEPGSNTIQIILTNPTDVVSASLRYLERYV
jgi:hypothetical protein